MDSNYCKICGELLLKEHICTPIFYFKHEDWGNEFQEIRAYHFCDAAEKFAIKYNQDYELINDSTKVIISDGKIEKKYIVSAEPDIHYLTQEIKD